MKKPELDEKVLTSGVKNKICVVVGTRPGIVKMSPVIKALKKTGADFFVIHAGQHYSYNMDRKFFEDLGLDEPRYRLGNVKKCKRHGEQTAEMLKGIEDVLFRERPAVVLVCADANFNLAGALAARKLGLKLGHVEAGLRSNDWSMPEEHNRVMIDHISDFLFAPTKEAMKNLMDDNVRGRIFLTGNTVVDSTREHLRFAEKKSTLTRKLGLERRGYFLLTSHREENVDKKEKLENLIETVGALLEKYRKPIVFPLHPRTEKRLKQFGLMGRLSGLGKRGLILIEPAGYLDFLSLLSKTRLVITDSGGVQEEACILKVPCVTMRENTERPETVEMRANYLAGMEKEAVLKGADVMLRRRIDWSNPFGEGAGKKIAEVAIKALD